MNNSKKRRNKRKKNKPQNPQEPRDPVPQEPVPVPVPEILLKSLIVMYARKTCSVCNFLKQESKDLGYEQYIKIIDMDSPEGSSVWQIKGIPNSISLPVFLNTANKKFHLGYAPINDIMIQLS